jgi:hypothetical protein
MSERMIFCLGKGKYESVGEGYQKNYRIFNKDVSKEVFDKVYSIQPSFKLPVSVWVDEKDMTDDEKKNNPIYKEIGGYLKVLSYKDAWKEGWKTASREFKDWVKNLPGFDGEMFAEITGLEFNSGSLKGKKVKVELDGQSYEAIIQ